MVSSKEQKCIEEIIEVLARYGYKLVKTKSPAENTVFSTGEEALGKIKRVYSILKNYEKAKEEVLKNKYAGANSVLRASGKINNVGQCREILITLGDIESCNVNNAEDKLKAVIDYLENK